MVTTTPPKTEPFALSPENGESVWFMGTLTTVKGSAENTGGAFSLVEQLAPPGYAPPLHVHHGDDELLYLLDGEATAYIGDDELHATPGSVVYAPHGIPHSYVIEGDEPARLLVFISTVGFERFFIEGGEPAPEFALPPAAKPTEEEMEKLDALCEKYGFEILGPPPGTEVP